MKDITLSVDTLRELTTHVDIEDVEDYLHRKLDRAGVNESEFFQLDEECIVEPDGVAQIVMFLKTLEVYKKAVIKNKLLLEGFYRKTTSLEA